MQERFNKLSDTIYPVTFGTFHSLFWGILREELSINSENILMGDNRLQLIKEALSRCKIESADQDYVMKVASEISYINNTSGRSEDYVSKSLKTEEIKLVYRIYQELKKKYKYFDFDDMIGEAYNLLSENEKIRTKWQSRFSYFLIDEMQDMNILQYKLIKLISCRTNNVFCVGDDDQSIYDFRGANPEIMLQFPDEYENARIISLEQNYRCPGNVVEASLKLIKNNKVRFDKNICSDADDGNISVFHTDSKRSEASYIADKIGDIIASGVSLDQIAILYRNHINACQLLGELLSRNIPVYIKEQFPNVFTHWIIQDMEAYFEIAVGNMTRQRMLRIMNRPNRYLVRGCVEDGADFNSMSRFYEGNTSAQSRIAAFKGDIELISKMSGFAAINYIRKAMGYDGYLREMAIKNGVEIGEYFETLDFLEETVKDCKTIKAAIDKIAFLKLKIDYENRHKKVSKDGKVGFYTLHSAKGLEFEEVFILECNEGVIPSKKSTNESEIEAERRLFYVGITRTKRNLYISSLNEKNRDRVYPSRFIDEIMRTED